MFGLDRFVKEFQNQKGTPAAILSNHATLSHSGYPAALELIRKGFSIKKLFSPEHGASSQGEDGKEQANGVDTLTRLPVISLYGKDLHPLERDLNDIELVLIDLPNIGCRFYTYWWTITYMIEVCAQLKKRIILLDRPNLSKRNPVSMEGPMLDEATCSSFLGRWSMPLTYSHSYGQLAQWFISERKISLPFHIVSYEENGFHNDESFIPPSPSMAEWQTTLIYPCTGLFEGLNLNTGRGTAFPFHVIGSPWLNAIKLFEDLSLQQFPGLQIFPYIYEPVWSRYAGEVCNGLYFHVSDPDVFRPVQTGIWLMSYLSIHYGDQLKPATYPTAANPTGENHLDLLLGLKGSYSLFCSGKPLLNSQIDSLLNVSGWTRKVELYLSTT